MYCSYATIILDVVLHTTMCHAHYHSIHRLENSIDTRFPSRSIGRLGLPNRYCTIHHIIHDQISRRCKSANLASATEPMTPLTLIGQIVIMVKVQCSDTQVLVFPQPIDYIWTLHLGWIYRSSPDASYTGSDQSVS